MFHCIFFLIALFLFVVNYLFVGINKLIKFKIEIKQIKYENKINNIIQKYESVLKNSCDEVILVGVFFVFVFVLFFVFLCFFFFCLFFFDHALQHRWKKCMDHKRN